MTAGIYFSKRFSFLLTCFFVAAVFQAVWTGSYLIILPPVLILIGYAGWQSPRFVFYLLLLTLPLSFEYGFESGLSTDVPDEFLMLFTSFLFIAAVLHQPTPFCKMLKHPLLLLFILWMAWMFLSAIFSSHILVSVKFLMAKGWYAGAFLFAPLLIWTSRENIVASTRVYLGSLLVIVLVILVRHGMEGFRFSSINDAVSPFFRNHVNYSAMLVCALPVIAGVYVCANSKAKRWMVFAIAFIVLPALFLAYSRGAWLALGAGLIAWWLLKRRQLLVTYVVCVLFSVAAFGWLSQNERYLDYAHDYRTTIFHSDFRDHLQATYQMKDISAAERFYRWIAAVNMTAENPVTGFGPGTFYNNYKAYTVPAFRTWVSNNPERSTAHNYFLLTAAEQGIPGLLILLVLIGACLWYAQRIYHSCTDILYKTMSAAAGTMIVMIIVLNLLSDLIETDKVGSLFFLSIALLIIAGRHMRTNKYDPEVLDHSDTSANVKRIS